MINARRVPTASLASPARRRGSSPRAGPPPDPQPSCSIQAAARHVAIRHARRPMSPSRRRMSPPTPSIPPGRTPIDYIRTSRLRSKSSDYKYRRLRTIVNEILREIALGGPGPLFFRLTAGESRCRFRFVVRLLPGRACSPPRRGFTRIDSESEPSIERGAGEWTARETLTAPPISSPGAVASWRRSGPHAGTHKTGHDCRPRCVDPYQRRWVAGLAIRSWGLKNGGRLGMIGEFARTSGHPAGGLGVV